MRRILTFLCLFIAVMTVNAQETEYRNLVKQLTMRSGGLDMLQGDAVVKGYAIMAKQIRPELSDDKAELLAYRYLNGPIVEKLIDMSLPLYKEEMSISDLREAMAFYDTPQGQSVASKLSKLMTMENIQAYMAPLIENAQRIVTGEPYTLTNPGVSADYFTEFKRLYANAELSKILDKVYDNMVNAGLGEYAQPMQEYMRADGANLICIMYRNVMNKEDIKALADFYATPVGKKVNRLNQKNSEQQTEQSTVIQNHFAEWLKGQ